MNKIKINKKSRYLNTESSCYHNYRICYNQFNDIIIKRQREDLE